MPYYGIDIWYIVLVIPALILSIYAQAKVKSTYAKYSKVMSRRGMTANDAVAQILRTNNIGDVPFSPLQANLRTTTAPMKK